MVWIERNLRVFQATAVVCAIVAAATVLWFNVPTSRVLHLTRIQVGAVALPWLVGILAFVPMLYMGWSRGVTSISGRLMIRAFTSVFLAAVLAIFTGIYGHFVFQLF